MLARGKKGGFQGVDPGGPPPQAHTALHLDLLGKHISLYAIWACGAMECKEVCISGRELSLEHGGRREDRQTGSVAGVRPGRQPAWAAVASRPPAGIALPLRLCQQVEALVRH